MNKTIIIIPTYNNPKTIKDVAFDVVEHGFECIICDDGSDIPIESLFNDDEKRVSQYVK